jgi:hypothetical protein
MHSASDPSRVRFPGPLAPFAAELRAELAALGYAPTSACNQLRLASHLSRWLQAQGLGPGDLSGPVLTRFLVDRRREYTSHYSIQALGPTLRCLRRVGAAPPDDPSAPVGATEELLARFRRYLLLERSVSVPVADAYVRWVRPFVDAVAATDPELTLEQVDAATVAQFLTGHLPGLTRKTAQMTASSLRSFLRFLHAEGTSAVDLSTAVPAFAFWRLSGIPQPLTPAQLQAVVGACDPSSRIGRRDLAVIACLLRLGLRCGGGRRTAAGGRGLERRDRRGARQGKPGRPAPAARRRRAAARDLSACRTPELQLAGRVRHGPCTVRRRWHRTASAASSGGLPPGRPGHDPRAPAAAHRCVGDAERGRHAGAGRAAAAAREPLHDGGVRQDRPVAALARPWPTTPVTASTPLSGGRS